MTGPWILSSSSLSVIMEERRTSYGFIILSPDRWKKFFFRLNNLRSFQEGLISTDHLLVPARVYSRQEGCRYTEFVNQFSETILSCWVAVRVASKQLSRTPGLGPEQGQKLPSTVAEILCHLAVMLPVGFVPQNCDLRSSNPFANSSISFCSAKDENVIQWEGSSQQ